MPECLCSLLWTRYGEAAKRLLCYPNPLTRRELYMVIGEVHQQLRPEPSPNPQWLAIPERGLYMGIAAIGAIGSNFAIDFTRQPHHLSWLHLELRSPTTRPSMQGYLRSIARWRTGAGAFDARFACSPDESAHCAKRCEWVRLPRSRDAWGEGPQESFLLFREKFVGRGTGKQKPAEPPAVKLRASARLSGDHRQE
jgi:hypothetical protein